MSKFGSVFADHLLKTLLLFICLANLGYGLRLTSSTGTTTDNLGEAVAMYDVYLITGSKGDDIGAESNQGSASIFQLTPATGQWTQQAIISATGGASNDKFGNSVTIYQTTVAVGASYRDESFNNQGAVFVFDGSGSSWTQTQKLTVSTGTDHFFGHSVSIYGDYLAIGMPGYSSNQGRVYIYHDTGTWVSDGTLTVTVTSNDEFGSSLFMFGTTVIVGSHYYGALASQGGVFSCAVLTRVCSSAIAHSSPVASDQLGTSVSYDGTRFISGAIGRNSGAGEAYVFYFTTSWTQQAVLAPSGGAAGDNFGYSVAISGNYASVGAPLEDFGGTNEQGSVSVFEYVSSVWSFKTKFSNHDPQQAGSKCGFSMFLADVDLLAPCPAAVSTQGAVYTYKRVSGVWEYVCLVGEEVDVDTAACVACSVGEYKAILGETCSECSIGTYNTNTGSTLSAACVNCSPGKYNDQVGQSACTDCAAGKFASITGASSSSDCAPCSPGTYSATPGQASCLDCQVNYMQPLSSSTSCDACPPSYCTDGQTGSTECLSCGQYFNIWDVIGCVHDDISNTTYDCPTEGGVPITIIGSGWNFDNGTVAQVSIGGKLCDIIYAEGTNSVVCQIPAGVGKDIEIKLTELSQSISGVARKLSYINPFVNKAAGCDDTEALPHPDGTSACSRDGFDEVTVTGNNFGPDQASVLIGGFKGVSIPLSSRGLSGWDQNTTIVVVPAGSGLGVGVNVLQKGGELSDGFRALSYKTCGSGYYNLLNSSLGFFECVVCEAGTINTNDEAYVCQDCEAGYFCNSTHATSCSDVLTASSSPPKSSDPSDCVCPSSLEKFGSACLCGPGEEYLASSSTCVPCGYGEYKDDWSLDACDSCYPAITTTFTTGSTSILNCTCPNNLDLFNGSCICPSGSELVASTATCQQCPSGEYKSGYNLEQCIPCPDIRMTSPVGSIDESACSCVVPFDEVDVEGSKACLCGPGEEYLASASTCIPCGYGEYKDDWDLDPCDSCSLERTTTTLSGSTSALNCTCVNNLQLYQGSCLCSPGTGFDALSESCVTCSSYQFQGSYSLDPCLSCSDSLMNGSNSCVCPDTMIQEGARCVCQSGNEFNADEIKCQPCDIGEFKSGANLGACTACEDDLATTIDQGSMNSTSCVCKEGYVDTAEDVAIQICIECIRGMSCSSAGSTLSSVDLRPGFWKEVAWSENVRECPYEEACEGSSDISNQCADGHTGPLCAVCEYGYDSGSRFEQCERCFEGSSSTSFFVTVCLLGLLVAFVGINYCQSRQAFKDNISVLVGFINTPSVRVKLKVLLIYFQIISQFQSILSASYPSNYSTFLSILQILNFNLSSILSLKCFDQQYTFHDEMMTSTLLPIFFCLFLILGYTKSSFFSGDAATRQRSQSGLIEWLLFVLYFFFASASRVVFEMFNCDDDFESGSSYLRADYRLTCSGPTYESYRAYAVLMIFFYPIGIPLLFFFVLFPHRNTINMEGEEATKSLEQFLEIARLNNSMVARRLYEVLSDYKAIGGLVFQKRENRNAYDRVKMEMQDRLKIEYSRKLPHLVPYAFLYEAYRPQLWPMECLECLRRLLLTGLLVFMYPGTEKQIVLAIVICMIFIVIYTWMRPFVNPDFNFVLLAALWGILFQLYGTLLLKLALFKDNDKLIGGLMTVVGVLFPLLPVFAWKGVTKSLSKHLSGSNEPRIARSVSNDQVSAIALGNASSFSQSPRSPRSPLARSSSRLVGITSSMRDYLEAQGEAVASPRNYVAAKEFVNPMMLLDSPVKPNTPRESYSRLSKSSPNKGSSRRAFSFDVGMHNDND